MKQIFAVTRGCYSDYNVICVCDTKERADLIVTAIGRDDSDGCGYRVQEFVYVDSDPQRVLVTQISARLFWESGRETEYQRRDDLTWDFHALTTEPAEWGWRRRDVSGYLVVRGTDAMRVEKVYGEKKAEILAQEPLHMAVFAGMFA